jgi:hypothetical protein
MSSGRGYLTQHQVDNAHGVSANGSGVYLVGDTEGEFPGQTQLVFTDAFLAKLGDDDKTEKH